MPAQIERVDDVEGAEVVGLAPHHLLTTETQRERRQQEIDEGFAQLQFGLAGMMAIGIEGVAVGVTDVVDRVIDAAPDNRQRRLLEATGMETTERRAVLQEVVLAFDLCGVPLHHEFGRFEARLAHDVLQVDEAFEFDFVGQRDDRLRGRQRRERQQHGAGARADGPQALHESPQLRRRCVSTQCAAVRVDSSLIPQPRPPPCSRARLSGGR